MIKKLRSLITLKKLRVVVLFFIAAVVGSVPTAHNVFAIDTEFYGGNDIIFYDPTCSGGDSDVDSELTGKDNIAKAFFYFTNNHGLTAAQSAGIVGNLIQESGVNPKSQQSGGPGRGIAQWSAGGRWEALKKWAGSKNIYDLKTQLDFMWYEMTHVAPWKESLQGSKNSAYPSLKSITGNTRADAIKAGHSFGYLYERFGVAGARDKFSGDTWQKYHSQVSSSGGSASDDSSDSGGSSSCASNDTELGNCDNAPKGWVQVTNKVVQIACTEWNKKVKEDAGNNCDKAGNITKYVKATHGGHCGEAWCGDFVGYVYKTAGFPFPASAGVAAVDSEFNYLGRINARKSSSTTPKPGDTIIYGSDHHHTGLVVGVQGKTITSIEGNTGADPNDKVNKTSLEGVHMHHKPMGSDQVAWGDFAKLSQKQGK